MSESEGRFRKRPVVIEAIHYTEARAKMSIATDELCERFPWLEQAYDDDILSNCARRADDGTVFDNHLQIKTLEGVMRCEPGDWLIRGVQGELYPCKPDIFAATYEPADDLPNKSPQHREAAE